MTKLLSPAAEAIFFAADGMQPRQYRGRALGAALRALADQIAPTEQNYEEASHKLATVFLNGVAYAVNEMRLIATELEGTNGPA